MSAEELVSMLQKFRVGQLQSLLHYANAHILGKKEELLKRAIDILSENRPDIEAKIREIYFAVQRPVPSLSLAVNNTNSEIFLHHPNPVASIPSSSNYTPHAPVQIPSQNYPCMYPMMPSHQLPTDYPPQYQLHPQIMFKEWPFFDLLQTIMRPTNLYGRGTLRSSPASIVYERNVQFNMYLRPLDSTVRLSMRFCSLDTTCKEQVDNIPPVCSVKVNEHLIELPPIIPNNTKEQRRQGCPVIVPNNVLRFGERNYITTLITCANKQKPPYAMALYSVRQLSVDILLDRLKSKGCLHPDVTNNIIRETLKNNDPDIALVGVKASLTCPLSLARMSVPCRLRTCRNHLQCFDAKTFLTMNERKPTWVCPICHKEALYKNLQIDTVFLDILRNSSPQCTEVEFDENIKWSEVAPPEESKPAATSKNLKTTSKDIVDLDDDSEIHAKKRFKHNTQSNNGAFSHDRSGNSSQRNQDKINLFSSCSSDDLIEDLTRDIGFIKNSSDSFESNSYTQNNYANQKDSAAINASEYILPHKENRNTTSADGFCISVPNLTNGGNVPGNVSTTDIGVINID